MDRQLSEFVNACRDLGCEKVTERKKAAEKVEHSLNRKAIVQALDKQHEAKQADRKASKNVFTWDSVFQAVCVFIGLETQHLQKGKESQSASAQRTLATRKQVIGSLFKLVIRAADNRGPKLKSSTVLSHIIDQLKDPFSCKVFGLDYSNVLLKNILCTRKYWVEIPADTWHELLNLYCKLYHDPDVKIDRVVVSRIINSLLNGASVQCDIRPKRLLAFFTEVFSHARQEKVTAVLEQLTSALNVFVKTIAFDSRIQICRLGEDILVAILYLWQNRKSETLKGSLTEFLQIQVSAHHPGGVKQGEPGAYAVDWDRWMSQMRKLYEVLYMELQDVGSRSRFTGTIKDYTLKPALLELAVDVCQQLFSTNSQVIEVTQQTLSGGGDTQMGPPGAKKRRLESGWSAVRECIVAAGQTVKVTPWLQLVTQLVEKYTASVPTEEIVPYLSCLASLLIDCKKSDMMAGIIQCVQSFADNWDVLIASDTENFNDRCKSVWMKVWTTTLRSVSLRHAEERGYKLLSAMMKNKIVTPEKDIWSLFIPSVSQPITESVLFLNDYLVMYDLPESYRPKLVGTVSDKGVAYPLRHQLMEWLLPGMDDEGETLRSNYGVFSDLLASVLVKLTVCNIDIDSLPKVKKRDIFKHLTALERQYLSTALELPLSVETLQQTTLSQNKQSAFPLPVLLNQLVKWLERDVEFYGGICEIQVKQLEELACCLSVSCQVMQGLMESGVVTTVNLPATGLIEVIKTGLKKLTNGMTNISKREGPNCLLDVFMKLKVMYNRGQSNVRFMIADFCRMVTPAKLLDLLIDIVTEKIVVRSVSNASSEGNSLSSRSTRDRHSRIIDDLDDDMDIEFNGGTSSSRDLEDLQFEDEMEASQDSEDMIQGNEVCQDLLSDNSLSEALQIRLLAVSVLCGWCSCDHAQSLTSTIKSEIDVTVIKSKIIDLMASEHCDLTRPFGLHLTRTVIEELTGRDQNLSDTDLDNMIEALKQAAKIHRRDQAVCSLCLSLMTRLVPHLTQDGLPTAGIQKCREHILHLLSAFHKLQSGGDYISATRLDIARVLLCLIQCDPVCDWTKFDLDTPEEEDAVSRFIESEADYSHSIRMFVSSAVAKLFVFDTGTGKEAADKTHQDNMFDQLYDRVFDSLDISVNRGRLSPDRMLDEVRNRTASALTALGTVICVSPVCEKKAVFAMCQLVRVKNIEYSEVNKVLVKVSGILGYRDSVKYVSSHLSYLIHQWLVLDYPLSDFPYQLLACDSLTDFYRTYSQSLVPELMIFNKLHSVEDVAKELSVESKDLLQDCVPKIVVHFLPLFEASRQSEMAEEDHVRRRIAKANVCYELLTKEITKAGVDDRIVSNLDSIVVNILMCLYEEDKDTNIRNLDQKPNPPFFNRHMTQSTLDYLTQSFSGSSKSLVEQLAKTPDSIQRILLELSVSLMSSHRMYDKRRVLMMYQLFVGLILKDFHRQLGGSWAFVLRDILYRMIYLIQDMTETCDRGDTLYGCYVESITCVALDLLRDVCCVAMETCPQELKKYLPLLVSNLTTLATDQKTTGEKSLHLLKYLVVENAATLRDTIGALDPFPDHAVYADCRTVHRKLKYVSGFFTLSQEVQHFLQQGAHLGGSAGSRLEGLKFLHEQLSSKTDQLNRLASEEENLLCRLVCRLVHLTKCGVRSVILEAGKCLGVIGPVNLNIISLPTEIRSPALEQALESFSETPTVHKYCRIFHLLNQYLTDKSNETVSCASRALKVMLSTKTGKEFMEGYKAQLKDTEYLFHYLHPFRCNKKKATYAPTSHKDWRTFQTAIDQESLWNPHHGNHAIWIQTLTVSLILNGGIRDELLIILEPVCSLKTEFCELILPFIIHDILTHGSADHQEVLSRHISNFFNCHCSNWSGRTSRCLSKDSSNAGEDVYICFNSDSIRTMLDVLEYLRYQPRPRQGHRPMTAWDNNFWLDVNYLQVAMAAQYCSAHFTTLLYAEIWCDTQRSDNQIGRRQSQSSSESSSQETRIDSLSVASSSGSGVRVQELLLEAYRCIGEPDGVYGCGAGRQADASSRIRTYEHENQWDKAVITCDIQMGHSGSQDHASVLQALQNFGATHILDTYLQGMMGTGDLNLPPETRELQYEAAWHMGQWDLDTPNRLEKESGFHQSLYTAVRAVKQGHETFAMSAIDNARLQAVEVLRDGSMESARRLYPVLANLQCLTVVENVFRSLNRNADFKNIPVLSSRHQENDFEFTAPVQNLSCSVLQMCFDKSQNREAYTTLVSQLQTLAAMARDADRPQIAERALCQMKSLSVTDLELQVQGSVEEARAYWARSEHNIAKHLMKQLIDRLAKLKRTSPVAAKFYPRALSIYGDWLADTRSENPHVIMENYLEKTVKLLEKQGDDKEVALNAYLSLARYADTQYQNIVNYMKSNTFEAKQSLMKKAKSEADRLREMVGADTKDRYLRTLEKQSDIDQAELQAMQKDKRKFLLKAVENYIKCLKYGDQYNLRVFRLTSLWFNNSDIEEVNIMVEENVRQIKSYKWLPLMYQLAARMDIRPQRGMSDLFLPSLNSIIRDCAVTHPHHTLFCVLALANANRDTELFREASKSSKRTGKLSKSQTENVPEEGRVQAAKNMVSELRGDRTVGAIVQDMEKLCDAYIQLANWNVQQFKTETKPIQLPSALALTKIRDLQNVPVPTTSISVDPSGEYRDFPYIVKFQSTFKLIGGINLPKIISCQGSDGRNRRQLVKGRDDLRQDAVMQQVFGMMNNLLKKNTETRKRHLQIRTYKVIPLSQRSGLLEWCEGTQPVGEYLIGNPATGVKGAHNRYNPQDWVALDCRNHLREASAAGKHKAYLEICKNFHPVLRHFFLENFSKPATWFERRLAYTRSVATNSIVGYILGLGDRHVQNILIDCNTAELVHIDLGVAFEQGHILPTPETVPFRLTRDIEDAMGACGVEGVFRRCCEKTMDVMRNNQETLLTILEVLLYDPLYAWTISPAKAYALQQRHDRNDPDTVDLNTTSGDIMDLAESSTTSSRNIVGETQENVNKLAERVLLRLNQKLQGLEDGVQMSISGQVNHLIQEARDTKNLSRLFPGWQPFL